MQQARLRRKNFGVGDLVACPEPVLSSVTFLWRLMAIDHHPLTVYNRQVEKDDFEKPVGIGAIEGAAKLVGAISQIPSLMPLGFIAKGLDLTGKCLNLGLPTVEENLKLFAKLTEEAILRHEEKLLNLQVSAEEAERFQRRAESKEFLQALASGVLQTQRTTQESRLKRMAWIIANGLRENDLEPENTDDMMRAAVELKEHDIEVLGSIHKMQRHLFSPAELRKEYSWRINDIHSLWDNWWKSKASQSYQGINGMNLNGSFARLQSAGLIGSIGTTSILHGSTMHDYELLPDGKKFYERLLEIEA